LPTYYLSFSFSFSFFLFQWMWLIGLKNFCEAFHGVELVTSLSFI
jgi:hypothetical protein